MLRWETSPEGWAAVIDKRSSAEIMDRSKQRGTHSWRIVLRGETAGSVLAAQTRVEALIDRLGVEAESPKGGAESRQPG
jgi:hypothetical protein